MPVRDAHGNKMAWWNLNASKSAAEGKALGHCGNEGGDSDDNINSLRTTHRIGGKTYHEPHLTFVVNADGDFGQMKGRGNTKPADRYHGAIKKLLLATGSAPKGGGYLPEENFHIDDLSDEHQKEIFEKRPELKIFSERTEISPEDITKTLESGSAAARVAAVGHPSATKEHISQALKDDDVAVQTAAIENPRATKEHVAQALKSPWYDTRLSAIRHPEITQEHLAQAMKDEDGLVRAAAVKHPKATSEQIMAGVKDREWSTVIGALENPNAKPEHIEVGIKQQAVLSNSSSCRCSSQHYNRATGSSIGR